MPTTATFLKADTPDIRYDYAPGLDLEPGSVQHNKIADFVKSMAKEGRSATNKRADSWSTIEDTLRAYMRKSDAEEAILRNDPRKPVGIVIPVSAASLDTWTAYMATAFLGSPIFPVEGRSPEDSAGAVLLEHILNAQNQRMRNVLNYNTMFMDAGSYGVGVVHNDWEERWGFRTIHDRVNDGSGVRELSYRREVMQFEGNNVRNIHPRNYLPDPNVGVHEIQRSEFVGYVDTVGIVHLLEQERRSEGSMVNAKFLNHLSSKKSSVAESFRRKDTDLYEEGVLRTSKDSMPPSNVVDIVYMYANIVPEMLDLPGPDAPEKWEFIVAADELVLFAGPLQDDHNMYPMVTCAPDYDGYSVVPMSKLEQANGLQRSIDWFLNSRFESVRKTLHGMFVVDPEQININDVLKPGGGKLLRIRPGAWNTSPKDAIHQLAVNDVTAGHIVDVDNLSNIFRQVTGASESMQGTPRKSGERVSATEARGFLSGSMSRMEKAAMIASAMAMGDIGYQQAMNTRQYMSQETFVKLSGEYLQTLPQEYGERAREAISVFPEDVDIDMDVIIKDGSIPKGDNAQQWIQLAQLVFPDPELRQTFDVPRIFTHIARMLGSKDVYDFVRQGGTIQPRVMEDEQVLDGASSGELIPIGG